MFFPPIQRNIQDKSFHQNGFPKAFAKLVTLIRKVSLLVPDESYLSLFWKKNSAPKQNNLAIHPRPVQPPGGEGSPLPKKAQFYAALITTIKLKFYCQLVTQQRKARYPFLNIGRVKNVGLILFYHLTAVP